MFCCAPPSIRKLLFLPEKKNYKYKKIRNEQQVYILTADEIFRREKNYLPKFTQHKIQEEPGFVIDDPSSIFYDPDEKAGFVYHSLSGGPYDIEVEGDEREAQNISALGSKSLDSSIDFDDSLDSISNLPTTPSVKEASFDRGYDDLSRKASNEQEATYSADEATYHSYNVDIDNTPVNLLLSTDHKHIAPQLSTLRIHEDSGYSSGGMRHRKDAERSYTSDAESTNKYQDSGIYEDDVFSDLSKHPSDMKLDEDGFLHDGELEMDEFIPGQSERLSAFKTPSSSPQKLEPGIGLSRISGKKASSKGRLSRFLQQEKEERQIITNGFNYLNDDEKECGCDSLLLHDTPSISKAVSTKTTTKYSHVQAKVQTRRKSSISPGRATPGSSVSPGRVTPGRVTPGRATPTAKSISPGRRTPSSSSNNKQRQAKETRYKPLHFGRPTIENKKLEFKKKAKPKVGSMENVSHAPGGGQNKIFNQKLEFKKHAEPRTDTHGVEMYSNLPHEFQEIARRLARQDQQLKLGSRQNGRGRATSRSSSTAASSRASSASPTRGRSQTRRPPTPSLPLVKSSYRVRSPSKHESLSRSSSIRSIPTTPNLHSKHPATSSILYDKKTRSRPTSPSSSRPQSPNRSCCSSRANSPTSIRSRSRSKSRSRPGTPKSGESQPTTPVRQLYQFTQSSSFLPGSPKVPGSQQLFHYVPVR